MSTSQAVAVPNSIPALSAFFPKILEEVVLDSRPFRVLGRLVRRAGRDGISFESIASISKSIGLAANSIKEAYRELIAAGFIRRIGAGRYKVKSCGFYVSARLDDAGLSPAEFSVYCQLCRWLGRSNKEVSLPELEAACGISIGTVRRAVDVLVARNMVRKTAQLGRKSRFKITPEGDWDTPIVVQPTLIKSTPNPDQKRTEPRSLETHKGKSLEGKLIKDNPLHPPTGEAISQPEGGEEGIEQTDNQNEMNHPSLTNNQPDLSLPRVSAPLSPPSSAAPPLSPQAPIDSIDDFVDNPTQRDRIIWREQRMANPRPNKKTIARVSKAMLEARLAPHQIEMPEFMNWCLPKFREWMNGCFGDDRDMHSVRRILLSWSKPLEYGDEDQPERHARLDHYILLLVKEKQERAAIAEHEARQAAFIAQKREELARIQPAVAPSGNPFQRAIEAERRRRAAQG